MDEIAELKARLLRAEEQARRAEEQNRRAEEQKRHAEEQKRHVEEQSRLVEQQLLLERAKTAKQRLIDFLRCCHDVCILTKPIHVPTQTTEHPPRSTKGVLSVPTHRLYPSLIQSWEDFSVCQTEIWTRLSTVEHFWGEPVFSSTSDFDYIRRRMEPITSERDLIINQVSTTESMVKDICAHVKESAGVSGLGQISFEGTQFLADRDVSLDQALEKLSISDTPDGYRRNRRADQLCVLRQDDGGNPMPVVAIEYKPPHKLTVPIVSVGLQSDIRPEEEIIDKFEDSVEFRSRNAMAAVITQLFSYMIDIGVQYGYITTGEVYVFMYITDDPGIVRYSVSIPKDDCEQDEENWKERTAVAQVFAFVQQALLAEPVDQAWRDKAHTTLQRWKVEFYDILADIPMTERVSRDHSAYRPKKWKRTRTVPFQLRNRCVSPERGATDDPSSSSGGEDEQASPTKRPQSRAQTRAQTKAQQQQQSGTRTRGGGARGSDRQRVPLQDRPYCSHRCLLGLAEGSDVDPTCPNAGLHGARHLPKDQFLQRLREQLATDRGKDADCQPMYVHGARGAMLKLCLTSHGYTMVAKGMLHLDYRHLANEEAIYRRLSSLQGKHIPACLGIVTLELPYYYQSATLRHLLLMSWAGRSLSSLVRARASPVSAGHLDGLATAALTAIHSLGVLHCDAELRNIMYDHVSGTLVLIDFERSRISERRVLGDISHNRRKKQDAASAKQASRTAVTASSFARELQDMQQALAKTRETLSCARPSSIPPSLPQSSVG